jgi:chromosome segregation ATPase
VANTKPTPLHIRAMPYQEKQRTVTELVENVLGQLIKELSTTWTHSDQMARQLDECSAERQQFAAQLAKAKPGYTTEEVAERERKLVAEYIREVAALREENDQWIVEVETRDQSIEQLLSRIQSLEDQLSTLTAPAPAATARSVRNHNGHIVIAQDSLWRRGADLVKVTRVAGSRVVVRVVESKEHKRNAQWTITPSELVGQYAPVAAAG